MEKGKITIEQGKQLNQGLKRVVKDDNFKDETIKDLSHIKDYINSLSRRIDELEKILIWRDKAILERQDGFLIWIITILKID